MSAPAITELLPQAATLPSLPEVVSHVLNSLADEQADVDFLVHHINTDPAIVARLLAAANSTAFGLTTRIESTRQAFMVLAVDRVRGIILSSALIHRFNARTDSFDARMLWRHSLGVALCARVIAEKQGGNAELAFTAGLLHDIGQLLMFAASQAEYDRVLERKREADCTILEAEQNIFGYDHAAAGQALARSWQLPRDISEAIAAHHSPEEFDSEMGDLIHVAEVLSHALDLGELPNNRVPPLCAGSCARLGLEWASFSRYFPEIEARYEGLAQALGL